MTLDQFDSTAWHSGMSATYHGDNQTYPVLMVDFVEQLVGLKGVQSHSGEVFWARCENVSLTPPRSKKPASSLRPPCLCGKNKK